MSLACICAALVCVFWGLLEFDGPVARHIRTITTPEGGGTLTVPWMAFVSHAGNWLGDGRQLLTVSAILLAAGWAYPPSRGIQTGIETLWAHGIATVLVHTVKHLVGRPRPKFSTSGDWDIAPSLLSGFDSFPSGHTTATFALAAVLARRFPRCSLLFFGAGAFVALSRVLRGSHFTTDVFRGSVLGLVSGALGLPPWKEWRTSVEAGVRQAAIGTVWIFALLWVVTHPVTPGWESSLLMGLGAVLAGTGLWGSIRMWWSGAALLWRRSVRSAIANLVSNAERYTPKDGRITLAWTERDDEGCMSVEDTGIGIETRHVPRITERFYRVDTSRSRETGGTGLRGAIVKHVLTHHQARLEVTSEPGKGSRFVAVFPARRVTWRTDQTATGPVTEKLARS